MEIIECPFCQIEPEKYLFKNKYCFAIYDKFPVSKGHILIIPFRHFSSFFDATIEEKLALLDLLEVCKKHLDENFKPDGYNIGVNIGAEAGQTIFHLHVHLIPRYKGDVEDPTGGVRGVIPDKRRY